MSEEKARLAAEEQAKQLREEEQRRVFEVEAGETKAKEEKIKNSERDKLDERSQALR